MSNGRKAKGGTSILKRLAGGNGDKTVRKKREYTDLWSEKHVPTEPTQRHVQTEPGHRMPRERTTYLKPAPERGRHERYRTYEAGRAGRERKPKVEREEHREKVEEHKRKHPHDPGEGNMWML